MFAHAMAQGNWRSVLIVVAEPRWFASSIPFRFYFRKYSQAETETICELIEYLQKYAIIFAM